MIFYSLITFDVSSLSLLTRYHAEDLCPELTWGLPYLLHGDEGCSDGVLQPSLWGDEVPSCYADVQQMALP